MKIKMEKLNEKCGSNRKEVEKVKTTEIMEKRIKKSEKNVAG